MRKFVCCLLCVLLLLSTALSHGGRTDGSGGHTDRSTGKYHYHHGYSAHDHENGVCPYDYEDKTNDYDLSSIKPTKRKKPIGWLGKVLIYVGGFLLMLLVFYFSCF